MITIKTEKEIKIMRESGKKLAKVMRELERNVRSGISTGELDELAEKLVFSMDATPAFKGYGDPSNPFPATICASLNDEVVHGIPSDYIILREGDILKIDVGLKYEGMFSDMARTFTVGKASEDARKIIHAAREAFHSGIKAMNPGGKMSDYSKAVQKYVESQGFSVVKNLVGHGIGKELHEDPKIPNYYNKKNPDFILKAGMTLALEPMINAGGYETVLGKDGWVFKTKDGSLSAHWENTVLVAKKGTEVLTV